MIYDLLMIRHGAAKGNLEKRYLGRTDQPLCPEGIQKVRQLAGKMTGIPVRDTDKSMPCSGRRKIWILSPMKRCLETARILRGTDEFSVDPCDLVFTDPDLRECDFGRFENHTYLELKDDPEYQAWIDSGGTLPFPDGEDPSSFRERSLRAFTKCVEKINSGVYSPYEPPNESDEGWQTPQILLIAHGGTIMSILAEYGLDENGKTREYFDWHADNAGGYVCRMEVFPDGQIRRIDVLRKLETKE